MATAIYVQPLHAVISIRISGDGGFVSSSKSKQPQPPPPPPLDFTFHFCLAPTDPPAASVRTPGVTDHLRVKNETYAGRVRERLGQSRGRTMIPTTPVLRVLFVEPSGRDMQVRPCSSHEACSSGPRLCAHRIRVGCRVINTKSDTFPVFSRIIAYTSVWLVRAGSFPTQCCARPRYLMRQPKIGVFGTALLCITNG